MAKKVVKYSFIAFLSGTFIVDRIGFPTTVVGCSMEPTLNGISRRDSYFTVKDIVWINRIKRNPQKSDIIAFIHPNNRNVLMIKRVIGIEGERKRFPKINDGRYFQIPQNFLCVGSDNKIKNISSDSYNFGPIPKGLVIGTATHIIWPPSRWGKLI
ncbi:Mitochondrial inner membrane protease subunit 2 [Strongyloides ratti]|uniref:Mitochondrial inner membrane protease subunit 2 n=1 Tax=Strongyloides ratti TaxID=34506 RepID=A0A090LKV0_STRRB|nr:Mitochondrial inner membrane protease subunit 2 [Strongyloides ratti]CEF70333.1 Mitochondrial inner membrane protease subunit 2 [Strongyloides ratti]